MSTPEPQQRFSKTQSAQRSMLALRILRSQYTGAVIAGASDMTMHETSGQLCEYKLPGKLLRVRHRSGETVPAFSSSDDLSWL